MSSSIVLLNRHLAVKESSPFTLVLDSLSQSAYHLIREFINRYSGPVVYLSFETINRPSFATHFLDCGGLPLQQILQFTQENSKSKTLVVVDSLNYIPTDQLTTFISAIALPHLTVVGVFHTNVPQPRQVGYPGVLNLLNYVALTIFEVLPLVNDDEVEMGTGKFRNPINCGLNQQTFRLKLTNRRKSGKSLAYHYTINCSTHEYEEYKPQQESVDNDELLKDLTTFNLTTSSKQRIARDQVDLPFLEAQTELGKMGGAIVYEFEKDDDYDEEDPYEDPF